MNKSVCVCAAVLAAAVGSSAFAGLAETKVGPLPQTYGNGGGAGFGGTLGGGSITMGVTSGNLDVSFAAGGGLNDLVVIRFDTRNGGVGDVDMNDQADGGRRAASSPIRDGFLNEPVGMDTYSASTSGAVSDYALIIGGFGSVLFELTSGTNLNFLQFNAAQNISIPLSSIANPSTIDWFAYYTSDSTFASNESMPISTVYNIGVNPGFGPGTFSLSDFNRFLVPAPGSAALLGLGGLLVARRRR